MSLMKWTLAMAGTAMGLRYMSDRHRRRSDGQSNSNSTKIGHDGSNGHSDDDSGTQRAPQTDRDADSAWSAPQSGSTRGGSSGMGSSV